MDEPIEEERQKGKEQGLGDTVRDRSQGPMRRGRQHAQTQNRGDDRGVFKDGLIISPRGLKAPRRDRHGRRPTRGRTRGGERNQDELLAKTHDHQRQAEIVDQAYDVDSSSTWRPTAGVRGQQR